MKSFIRVLSLIVCTAICISTALLCACDGNNSKISSKSAELGEKITKSDIEGKPCDEAFENAYNDFAVNLFKKAIKNDSDSLISPLSVMTALAMTANGADHNTLEQMESVLGGLKTDDLNLYLGNYLKNINSTDKVKFNCADSIWIRDEKSMISVNDDFLQKIKDYYNAQIYTSPFDSITLADINAWVKKHTDGMIDKVLDKIDESTVMYLINALCFDAEWESKYESTDIIKNFEFHCYDGSNKTTEAMHSFEHRYIHDDEAVGFIKNYAGGKYAFAAILPNESTDINDYIASLDGGKFAKLLSSESFVNVTATMPKFSFDYEILLNDTLKQLGMTDAFDSAACDLSRIGHSDVGNLFISSVLHKTFISVDELGTKAGAVTVVTVNCESALESDDPIYVTLDRPFVFAIIDTEDNLPIFIGSVLEAGK